jgi:hypothetical protein
MIPVKTFEMRTCILTLSLLHNKPKAVVHKLTGPKEMNSFPDKAKTECQSKFENLSAIYADTYYQLNVQKCATNSDTLDRHF